MPQILKMVVFFRIYVPKGSKKYVVKLGLQNNGGKTIRERKILDKIWPSVY